MEKKGEITSGFIVGWVIAIVGFIILVLFIYSFDFQGTLDREICHQSVLYRGTLTDKLDAKDVVPLNCQTRNLCFFDSFLGMGKGKCKIFGSEFESEEVSGSSAQKEAEIKEVIAKDMADCWNTMGRGKLQVFEREVKFSSYQNKCVVCTVIDFDESVNDLGNIYGMRKYLLTKNVPESEQTYMEYLTNGGDVRNLLETPNLNDADVISTTPKAVIYVESGKTEIFSFFGLAGGGVGGAFLVGALVPATLPGVGLISLVGIVSGAGTGYSAGQSLNQYIGDFEGNYVSGIALEDYDTETLKKLNCATFESIQ